MVNFTVPVVVNHGVLCWVSGCELCCAMLVNHGELYWANGCDSWFAMLWHWLWVMVSYAELVVMNHMCYAEPNSFESCCVILSRLCLSYGVLCRAIGYKWYEPVVVNYGVLFWTSGCESWCVMLSKWLWVMESNAEPVVVNHGVLCWASDCESFWVILSQWLCSWCVMLGQCLWIMVCYTDPVVVNYGVLCFASGFE
jgi:hypothetical protein